jgi:hypothetical protein
MPRAELRENGPDILLPPVRRWAVKMANSWRRLPVSEFLGLTAENAANRLQVVEYCRVTANGVKQDSFLASELLAEGWQVRIDCPGGRPATWYDFPRC